MNVFDTKYFVFVISAGRTGTKFFGDRLSVMVRDAFSVHEPDVFPDFTRAPFIAIRNLAGKIRIFGLYQMVWGRLLRRAGIRQLSQNYSAGKIDRSQAAARIVDHRRRYYTKISQPMIAESYYAWYGLIPAIQSLFKHYKIVVVVRDPRDWVVSNMDWQTFYGRRDWVGRLGWGRLSPAMLKDEGYADAWRDFSRFQKLCWTWKTIYQISLTATAGDSNARVVRFEDIFLSDRKYEALKELLDFMTRFPDRQFEYTIPEGILEHRIHTNIAYRFPRWEDWNADMQAELLRICGGLAARFDYLRSPAEK